jgi:Domain of unknown function (DUF5753)/Helix-turn-helix domain
MTGQTPSGSAVARRLLGWCLRDLRQEAKFTVKMAALALEWSQPKLWRIETGLTTVRGLDVEAMCALYGAAPALTQDLMRLVRVRGTNGWWHAHSDAVPGGFDVYTRLEEQAHALLGYEPWQVPALLRTEAYARALTTGSRPGPGSQEADQLVRECLARQVLVTRARAPLSVTLILGEALVRCPVGGPDLTAQQFRHLAELSALPNIRLRAMPFSAGQHPGLRAGPFTLLRFPPNKGGDESAVTTVYVPGLTGDLYLDDPHDVEYYSASHAAIFCRALDESATQDLLWSAAKQLER